MIFLISFPRVVRLAVLATDWSTHPPRSVAVAVQLTVNRSSTRPIDRVIFDAGFYSVEVPENVPIGHCVLTVSELGSSSELL